MNRRSFLVGASIAAAVGGQQGVAAVPPQQRTYPINRNWLFQAKTSAGAETPGFDEAGFARVSLPHGGVELSWHSFDDRAYQFISTYRRHVRVPESWRGQRVFVDFGGVMTAARVFINGHAFEEYRGGYTPFSFELTPHLKYGADNVLAVIVDSTERADI